MTSFPPPPAAARSVTSRSAAEQARPHASTQRRRVYDALSLNPGATRESLAKLLQLSQASVAPRVRELIDAGFARVIDDRGRTSSGCSAERLMATAKPYSEAPVEGPEQLPLPGLEPSQPRRKTPLTTATFTMTAPVHPARPSLVEQVTRERETAEAIRAKADSDVAEYRKLEASHGSQLDALNDHERAALVARLSPAQQELFALLPKSKTLRFELLRILSNQGNQP